MIRKYDLIILGAGIAGLSAAFFSLARGKKVLVLDPASAPGGVLADAGDRRNGFQAGPHASYGFERHGSLQQLLTAIGFDESHAGSSCPYQVALPDKRITISADHQQTLDELRREFPRDIDKLARLYREVHARVVKGEKGRFSYMISHRGNAADFLSRYRFGSELIAYFNVQTLHFFGRSLASLPLSNLLTMIDTLPRKIKNGLHGLAVEIHDVAQRRGGDFRFQTAWQECRIHSKRIRAIVSGGDVFEAKAVILNAPDEKIFRSLFLEIRSVVIPVGMAEMVICLPDYAAGDAFFSLSLEDIESSVSSSNPPRSMTVSFPSGFYGSDRSDLLRFVRDLVPFLDDFTSFAEVGRSTNRSQLMDACGGDTITKQHMADMHIGPLRSRIKNLGIVQDCCVSAGRSVQAAASLMNQLL